MREEKFAAGVHAAIDFGISNTDAVAYIDGQPHFWHLPYRGLPDEALIREVLAMKGIELDSLAQLAVTGGRHQGLPPRSGKCTLVGIREMEAIGRGGQLMATAAGLPTDEPLLVVSAGSGTAVLTAHHNQFRHFTGTAVGGGTLIGLSKLLVQTTDPREIDELAQEGNANRVDLSLADVVLGEVGNLPMEATAVHFGRIAREPVQPSRADYAAALVSMVAQVIALLAINAARAAQTPYIVVTGHLADMVSVRYTFQRVAEFYHATIVVPPSAGYATALGALALGANYSL